MIAFILGMLCMICLYGIFCFITEWLDNDGWW